jgi:hypothetical protein
MNFNGEDRDVNRITKVAFTGVGSTPSTFPKLPLACWRNEWRSPKRRTRSAPTDRVLFQGGSALPGMRAEEIIPRKAMVYRRETKGVEGSIQSAELGGPIAVCRQPEHTPGLSHHLVSSGTGVAKNFVNSTTVRSSSS